MVALAIDYGAKRVGVAVSHDGERPVRMAALPNGDDLVPTLRRVAEQLGVTDLVLGLPRSLDGDDTAQTKVVRRFADELEAALKLKPTLQDEADTTNLARERLTAEGINGNDVKLQLDSEAAVIILEDYLAS